MQKQCKAQGNGLLLRHLHQPSRRILQDLPFDAAAVFLHLRQHHPCDAQIKQPQDILRMPGAQQLDQFHPDPLRADIGQVSGQLLQGLLCACLNGETQLGRKPHSPQDAQGVLLETLPGLAHAADSLLLQIVHAAEEIHQPLFLVVRHGIDRKIPPSQVLRQFRRKLHLAGMPVVLVFSVDPIGGHLITVLPQQHRDRPMDQPGIHRAGEQLFYLQGPCRCGDVPVIRHPPQDCIPDTAAHRIGLVAVGLQRVDDPGDFRWEFQIHINTHAPSRPSFSPACRSRHMCPINAPRQRGYSGMWPAHPP